MDSFSVVVRIIGTIRLTSDIVTCLHDAKGLPMDHTQCEIELSNVSNLLSALNYHIHEQASSNEPWHLQVKALVDGPVDQYTSTLQQLKLKLTSTTWESSKEEVSSVLSKVKRLKSLIEIALQKDHLELSQALKNDTAIISTTPHDKATKKVEGSDPNIPAPATVMSQDGGYPYVKELDDVEQLKDFLRRGKNFFRRLIRPPIPKGSQRVEWICGCGELLYMDFNSNSTSLLTISALFFSSLEDSQLSRVSDIPNRSLLRAISMPMLVHSIGNISQNSTTQLGPAPRLHSSSPTQTQIGTNSTTSTVPTESSYKFLELCVNSGKLLKTLGEIDVSSINTDGEFFGVVKSHYLRLRSFRAWFWLLKPVNVSYVRFSVEDRYRVGILDKPLALPPKSEVVAKRYHYDPCPLENELPISSDLFLHYLFSGCIPSRHLIWLPRIPRKLDQSIFASTAPVSYGWGVHIDEGLDYLKVFVLNLVILGVSGAAALLWDIYKQDFQGAMGFAAWIIMLLNTLMAIFIAKWSQE